MEEAGTRIHGTTQRRPLEHFLEVEHVHLLSAPTDRYDVPVFVRAKVACLRAGQRGDPHAWADARQLTGLTLSHLRAGAVTLVLVGGLPGTGKTVLAGELAGRLGFTVLSSDRIRKELAGVAAEQRCGAPWGTGIYTAGWTERTYCELLRRAGLLLALGESVIVDASWTSAGQRAAATSLAATAHADLVPLRCIAPADVAQRRLTARQGGVSDADAAVARTMAAAQEPWPEAVTIDTGGTGPSDLLLGAGEPPGAVVAQRALEAIRPHGPQHLWRPGRPVMLPG